MPKANDGHQEVLKIFKGLSASYEPVLHYCTLMQDSRWKEWIVRRVHPESGEKVLDLGCGTCLLEEHIREDCLIVGLDLTKQMLRIGRARRPQTTGFLLLSDGEKLPFKEGVFDAVVSCYVVKYCESKVLAAEVARVLRPGGRLAMYDFVRPRGWLWPLNAIYTYGGLPFLGQILSMVGGGSAYTFRALPKIIADSRWEETLGDELSKNGFFAVKRTLLSGGAAMGFAATMGA